MKEKSSHKFQEKMNLRLVFAISGSLYLSVLLVSYLLALFYPFLTPYCWLLIPVVANFFVGYLTEDVETAVTIVIVSFFLHTAIVIGLLNSYLVNDAFLSWFGEVQSTSNFVRNFTKHDPSLWMVIIIVGYPIMNILLGIPVSLIGTIVRGHMRP